MLKGGLLLPIISFVPNKFSLAMAPKKRFLSLLALSIVNIGHQQADKYWERQACVIKEASGQCQYCIKKGFTSSRYHNV